MTPGLILACVGAYTVMLFVVTWITSRGANNESYFVGNRNSRWWLVAYGMIGASLSGVTFMSVPGDVGSQKFSYFQVVLGYLLGYMVIAYVLLPLYYRMNLTSIYTYLEKRLGTKAYKTGAFFFIVSRVLGAACRMYIVVLVLHIFIFKEWGVPFWATSAIFVVLILLYTFEGGVKTIVWTDSLQTTFMLLSLVLSVVLLLKDGGHSFGDLFSRVSNDARSQITFWDWESASFFPKSFFGGMFIAVTMTGLDQEMMQKNISCRSVGEAQKNVVVFSTVMVLVNLLFLSLGVLLWQYVDAHAAEFANVKSDVVFPTIALNHLGTVSALFFIIGLISAAYPSADGALTALTASFCIDFLNFNKPQNPWDEKKKKRVRYLVHTSFALVLLLTILVLYAINEDSVLRQILFIATLTYGPLLGLFAFGILTKRNASGWGVVIICVIAPLLSWWLKYLTKQNPEGYQFGYELLIVNGLLTFAGLWIISMVQKKPEGKVEAAA